MRSRTVIRAATGLFVLLVAIAVWVGYRASRGDVASVTQRLDDISRHARDDREVTQEIERLGVSAYPELVTAVHGIETPGARLRRRVLSFGPLHLVGLSGLRPASIEDRQDAALKVLERSRLDSNAVVVFRALVSALEDPRISGEAAQILSRIGPSLGAVLPELQAGMDANIHRSTATNYLTVLWSLDAHGERWLGFANGLTNDVSRALSRWAHAWESGDRAAFLALLDGLVFGREGESPIRRDFAVKCLELIGPEVWPLKDSWVERLGGRQSLRDRELTVWLVGLVGPTHATSREVDALLRVVDGGEEPWVRVGAIRSLGQLGERSRKALEGLLQGADEESIQAARTALMELDRRR